MGPTPNQGYDENAASDEAARLIAVKEFVAARKAARQSNSEAMHEDLLMLKGGEDQWDPDAVRERKGKRPLYTGNRFPAMLAQITGEIRRNKPGISCKPGDAAATPENAEIFEGIIRAIERLSQAPLAYARAGKSAAACGEGHLRIVPVREDDEGFDTGLRIRAIKNVHSVLWDAGAQAPDRSDANRCVVFSEVDRKGFEESYPQAGTSAWEKASAGFRQMDGWRSDTGKVTVAEEWVVKREPYERYRVVKARPAQIVMGDGQPTWTDASNEETIIDGDVRKTHAEAITIDGVPEDQYLAALTANGFDLIDRRTAYKKTICMYLWGGNKQIAGPIEWKGSRIPIFTVVGEEIDVGEETVTHGIIRHAKDAQRLFNYARSADLELVAQAPKSPIIAAAEQLDGWESEWVLAQRTPVPYLPYNHVPGLPAPQERAGPGFNSGPNALSQAGITDMQDVVGIHDASLGKKSNETSGVAIEARDAQADTGTYVYLDNLNATIEAIGSELVAAIPHYYSAREQIMILGVDDAPAIVQMAGIKLDQGKYHVIAQRGPSYQSKREKAADLIAKTMNVAPPPAIPILFKTLFELSDVPDGDRISEEMTAAFVMAGLMPPPQEPGAMPGMPGMPPGMPGAPPMPGGPGAPPMPGAPPSNVIPMPPRGGPPMGADPLAGIAPPPVSPPNAPAVRTRAGPSRPPGI